MPDPLTQADVDKAIKDALAKQREEFDTETAGLKDKNRELLGKLRDAQGVKPEDLATAEARADKAEADLAALNKSVTTLTKERDNAVKALEAETGFTSKLLINDGIKSALIEAGVKDPDYLDALAVKFASSASILTEGDARKAMIGDKAAADAIKEWAGSDTGKKFIAAPVNSGGGAGGGNGGGSGKAVTQEAFNAMSAKDRASFMADGGKIAAAA